MYNKLMDAITGSILIDFQNSKGSEEERQYNKQVYSAIKLNISEMEKYEKTSHFIMCQGCKMVLTVEDKKVIYDWDEINSQPAEFKDVYDQCKEVQDKMVVWICTFCERRNAIYTEDLKFAKNNQRVVERAALKSGHKRDPILLILFDISGSMEELIQSNQNTVPELLEKIKKTSIYQKIVAQEEKDIKEIIERQKIKPEENSQLKYHDYLKKNKLLMGLTELLVDEISPSNHGYEKMERANSFQSSSGASVKKTRLSKSVGFMFFNSNVIFELSNHKDKQKKGVIVCDTNDTFSDKNEGMARERVNFYDFENLFKIGEKHGHQFSLKLNQHPFNSLDIRFGDSSHGQTALGPAIVMALGAISNHGAGSSIVVVTDGIGNKGIFDHEDCEEELKMLKNRLQKYKCFLAILECRNINNKSESQFSNITTCIDKFCVKNEDTICRKINIILDKNKSTTSIVEDIKKKMIISINRDHVLWTNEVIIRCQNSHVSYEDEMTKLTNKLHNQLQPTFINPKVNFKALKEKDYMHHFMTQAVIRYENNQTGEQSIFMTYILQKFMKAGSIKRKTMKSLDNQKTFHNIMEYLSVEEENYEIKNIPLSFLKKTFRNTLMLSKSICNRSMRFPSIECSNQSMHPNTFLEELRKNIEENDGIREQQDEDENLKL